MASPFLRRSAIFTCLVSVLTFSRVHGAEPAAHLTSRPRPVLTAPEPIAVGKEIRTGTGERQRFVLPDGSVLFVNQQSQVKVGETRKLELTAGEIFLQAAAGEKPFVVRAPRREVSGAASHVAVRVEAKGDTVLVTRGSLKIAGLPGEIRAGQRLAADADQLIPAPRAVSTLDWARELMAAAEPPLAPPSRHQGGRLVAVDPNGHSSQLTLRRHKIDVHIEDGFARTTVDQTYFNEDAQRLEGTFYFPLPADASLSRLAMYVDGRLMEGGMTERDYGRTVYEEILYRQKDPALLEWVDGTTFKMRVFPLEPRQEKRILLSYTQRLPVQYGGLHYRFPAGHSLGTVRDWSLHVRVKNGAKQSWSSVSHELKAHIDGSDLLLDATEKNARLDRDVVLAVSEKNEQPDAEAMRFASAEHEGAKYLMVRYRPGLPGTAERKRRDWVVLFEASGDRDPLLARVQIEVLRGLLANAEPDDTFSILAANTRVRILEAKPVTPANIEAAVAFLENLQLIGALDLAKALDAAAPLLRKSSDAYLVQLGSGIAALGERRADVLAKKLPENARYVGVAVGRRWDRTWMQAAASRTGGYFTQINPDESTSWRSFELSAALNAPRLLNVRVADAAGKIPFRGEAATVAQGEELFAVARLAADQPLPESVRVTGVLAGRPFERMLPVKEVQSGADYLPRTWAKLEIDRLLRTDAAKHRKEIIALSKAMVVMTPFTSLLVLENDAMYAQYKVDRGRKDHWAMYACPPRIPVVYEPLPGMPAEASNLPKGQKPNVEQVVQTVVGRCDSPSQGMPVGYGANLNRDARDVDQILRMVNARFSCNGLGSWSLKDLESLQGYVPYPPVTVGQIILVGNGVMRQRVVHGLSPKSFPVADLNIPVSPYPGGQPREEMFVNLLNNVENFEMIEPTKPLPTGGVAGMAISAMGGFPVSETPTGSLMFGVGVNSNVGLTGAIVLGERSWSTAVRGFVDYDMPSNGEEWERIWFTDHPSRLTPERTNGGIDSPLARGGLNSLLYQRPTIKPDDAVFFDLVAYAPGMETSAADVQAIIEAEAALPHAAPGKIDAAARRLIDNCRAGGWRTLTFPAANGQPAWTIAFDGAGRYAWERTLPPGLKERVVCDGQMLRHLYPDLGIGAERAVSRFHRAAFSRLAPWVVPPADDQARGCDLIAIEERTVAVVPRGIEGKKNQKGKPVAYVSLHLVFAEDGHLAERRLVEMPEKKVLRRELLDADGAIRLLDGAGKELANLKTILKAADAPDTALNVKDFVVLALPYRTPEHVKKSFPFDDKKAASDIPREKKLALFAAELTQNNGGNTLEVFRKYFGDGERSLGLYVLMASRGINLDAEHADVLAAHPDSPLAQYLALYSSPILRKHASQWAVRTGQWGDGYLKHLAVTHAFYQRWQTGRVLAGKAEQRQAELQKALDYARQNRGSAFGWALLALMQDRAAEEEKEKRDAKDVRRILADGFALFADSADWKYAARYEQARSLYQAGEGAEARRRFRELYEQTFKEERLPRIDADFRNALADGDAWGELLRKTATQLIEKRRRTALLLQARQCVELGELPLAIHLCDAALAGAEAKERDPLTLAVVLLFNQGGDFARAERLLEGFLGSDKWAKAPGLWRLAAEIAESRDRKPRQLECLERALEAEYARLPEVINVKAVRSDYERLLGHYQALADAMVTLRVSPPADFRAKVVRAADRWRALDTDADASCQAAARILQTLGERDLAWDYLTTPVGKQPGESGPWVRLAEALNRRGDLELADRAYSAAFAVEPTDAQLLWDRAQNLRQAGKTTDAQQLLRRLADGPWQPRFNGLQSQARWQLRER